MKLLFPLLLFATTAFCADNDVIPIGWIGPLSGDAAALGVDSAEAMRMVFDEVNAAGGVRGKRFQLLAEDDRYTTAKTVNAYYHLVKQKGVRVIVVVTYGGLFAISPLAEQDDVLLIDPLDCDEKIAALPKNTICISKTTEDIARPIAEHAVNNAYIPAAILYDETDAFPVNMGQLTRMELEKLGVNDISVQGFSEKTPDFRPTLLQLRKKKIRSLFLFGYDPMGLAMRQARDLGMKAQFYATAPIASEGHQAAARGADAGTIVPLWKVPQTPAYQSFLNTFKKRVGRAPYLQISTLPSYDIAKLLLKAFDSSNDVQTSELRKFFYLIKNFSGISGNMTIDPDGATRSFPVSLTRFENGKFEPLRK